MVTGASTADLAVILIDARKGVLTQTRRHSYLVSLLGIRHVVLAINKMDLVDYSQDVFDAIEDEYRAFAQQIGLADIVVHPALGAARATTSPSRSANMPWYARPDADGAPRDGARSRTTLQQRPVPPAGAVGQPAEPRLPRLRRARSPAAASQPGDRVRVAALGQGEHGRAHRRR